MTCSAREAWRWGSRQQPLDLTPWKLWGVLLIRHSKECAISIYQSSISDIWQCDRGWSWSIFIIYYIITTWPPAFWKDTRDYNVIRCFSMCFSQLPLELVSSLWTIGDQVHAIHYAIVCSILLLAFLITEVAWQLALESRWWPGMTTGALC